MAKRYAEGIIRFWLTSIERAIQLGDADAAYKLTVAFVRRLRELQVIA